VYFFKITVHIFVISITCGNAYGGGLFGDGGLIIGDIGALLEKNIQKSIVTPIDPLKKGEQFEPTINSIDIEAIIEPQQCDNLIEIYDDLSEMMKKRYEEIYKVCLEIDKNMNIEKNASIKND